MSDYNLLEISFEVLDNEHNIFIHSILIWSSSILIWFLRWSVQMHVEQTQFQKVRSCVVFILTASMNLKGGTLSSENFKIKICSQ
jgi:hypothetical protein